MVVPKDCPRCASVNTTGERFCWLCGWDFVLQADSKICEKCGLEIKKNDQCVLCGPSD